MNDLLAELGAPFPRDRIHWRVGATNNGRGIPLAYLNARDVMERLDEVVGPQNWQDRYEETAKRLICYLSIRTNVVVEGIITGPEWITKADGAGDTNMEGEKGGLSDAFKRAAVKWNIGRYLYNCENRWVDLENGKYLPKNFGQGEILKAAENAFSSPQMRKKYLTAIRETLAENNASRLNEDIWPELNTEQVQEIWRQLASNERSAIKALREAA